jgi:hypothetical protein
MSSEGRISCIIWDPFQNNMGHGDRIKQCILDAEIFILWRLVCDCEVLMGLSWVPVRSSSMTCLDIQNISVVGSNQGLVHGIVS